MIFVSFSISEIIKINLKLVFPILEIFKKVFFSNSFTMSNGILVK